MPCFCFRKSFLIFVETYKELEGFSRQRARILEVKCSTMIIEKLPGTDARLYMLVAPLVMSVPVIRQNNNYPFKTSRKHLWFVVLDRDSVVGFMPVERKTAGAYIDNYYAAGDSPELLMALIGAAVAEFASEQSLSAMVHVRHADIFKACGFSPVKNWKLYVKMEYGDNEQFQEQRV